MPSRFAQLGGAFGSGVSRGMERAADVREQERLARLASELQFQQAKTLQELKAQQEMQLLRERARLGGTDSPLAPRKLSENTLKESGEIPSFIRGIRDSVTFIEKLPSLQRGPVFGRAARFSPFFAEEAKQAEAAIRAESQRFGRFMEGGVLRREDEEKYFRIFPQLTDLSPVARFKGTLLQRMLAEKNNHQLEALQSAGFDTRGLQKLPLPPLPKLGKQFQPQMDELMIIRQSLGSQTLESPQGAHDEIIDLD